ncbi:MAG: hypothetical protein NTV87_11685, partial [Ignavibacteriae bacterium]|nr:hypothetical protein [Ignavibacteriota bacterium]
LMPDVTANNFVDLSGINAYQYPYLKLITKLNIDSINGYQSPVFRSITFNYVPASELALDNNSTIKSDSIVTMGDSVGFGITYYNVGFTNVNGVVRNFFAYDQNGNKVNLRTDTVQTVLKIDSSGFIKATLPVSRMPIFKKYSNQVNFNFEVQPLAQQNEIYTYNNTVNSNFFVKGSPLTLNLDVFSDGVKIMGGDYVRLKPEILVKLSKQNSDSLTMLDTSFIRIFVNNNILIFAGNKRDINGGVITETGKDAMILKFTPELKEGQNEFRFITMNAGKNSYDTAKYSVTVSNELMVKDLYNYPNPMKSETTFTFNLAGSNIPTDCRIKIFSVARVVKTLKIPASIGVNQYPWDGRDEDGDYMANGVYFYKVIIEGDNQKETALQKLAILR